MRRPTVYLILAALFAPAFLLQAQTASPLPPTNADRFAPIEMPSPTQDRLGTGQPGPGYWQQRADYQIAVTLDTAAHRVSGHEVINYTNRSPDALDELWLQLDQNLFAQNSTGSLVNPDNRWRGSFTDGGFQLEKVELVNGKRRTPARYQVLGTRMQILLDHPVTPGGGTVQLALTWSFVIPQYGADRMGRYHSVDGWIYQVAQWYPRMAVYDDQHGWNTMPYLGQGEFYLEYGDFDVSITVPHDLIVVATGTLQNPDQVLTAQQRERLERARGSAETVSIVSGQEVGQASTRPGGTGPLTWRFHAENVRDMTWAASRAFIWDAAGWDGVTIMSVYPREGLGDAQHPGWEEATRYARHTISYYSTKWYRYPYPVAINVAGVVGGMEYPMIVFCGVRARGQGLFGVTDHEFGHTWFPMIVGSDERRYAWMDEGFNTFINYYSNLDFYGDSSSRAGRTSAGAMAAFLRSPLTDQPIMTYPDRIRPNALGFLAYSKPGAGLVLLREVVLGPKRFDAAFRHYIAEWAYKHPMPADFFRAMEEESGEDLSWFWRGWFYHNDQLDQSVDSVASDSSGTRIYLSNNGALVMPVPLQVDFADGTSRQDTLPVDVWVSGQRFVWSLGQSPPVRSVTIDPGGSLPDADRRNNVLTVAPATAASP